MKTKKSVVGKILIYLFLILLALLFLVPVFYVICNSFAVPSILVPFLMPSLWSLDSYKELFSELPIMKWYGNTAVSTVAVVLGNIFFYASQARHGFSSLRKGKSRVCSILSRWFQASWFCFRSIS